MLRSLIFFVAISVSSLIAAQPSEKPGDPGTTRSVILIIGDGFDDQHVTMGRNFLAQSLPSSSSSQVARLSGGV